MSWLVSALNNTVKPDSEVEIIYLNNPLYQGKMFYMEFIKTYPFGKINYDEYNSYIEYSAKFYNERN